MKVAIVGAGIGGLTAALACRRAGLEVALYERVESPGEVGAGLQISPNGTKVLLALGLGPALEAVAFRPNSVCLRLAESGRLVLEWPLGQVAEARYGAPYLQLHRADLYKLLFDAVIDRCGQDAVHLGRELAGFEDDGARVILRFAGGGSAEADVLVGADGIHSQTRQCLLGDDRPVFTGHVAWRGVVPADRLAHLSLDPVVTSWMAPHSHAITYFLRGGELVNFVGIREQGSVLAESWTGEGDTQALLRDLDSWHPTVREIAGAIERPLRWGLFTRKPLARWTEGRVALLGDACHPMLPYMAQGAVTAMEDAWILAANLAAGDKVPLVLRRYQQLRQARTARIQRTARANGELFHTAGQLTRLAVFGGMALGSRMFPGLVSRRFDWIMGYDAVAAQPINPA